MYFEVCSLIFDLKYSASEHDWFNTTKSARPWAFAIFCHGFIVSALKLICLTSSADTKEALRDRDTDSLSIFFAKQLKRGVVKLSDSATRQAMLTMMSVTQDVVARTCLSCVVCLCDYI